MTRGNGPSAPLPNPPFVFPAAPKALDETNDQGRIISGISTTGSQRSEARSRPSRLSLNALPAFDFSPATSSPTKSSSPSRSPSRPTPPIPIGAGHRRNGSEYVGGDIAHGGPMLVSTSPTKSELSSGHRRNGSEFLGGGKPGSVSTLVGANPTERGGLASTQSNMRLGPPTAQRGHAHRRSGAVSSHDLSMILKPPTEEKAGSAPTTPSDPMFQRNRAPELDRSVSQPVLLTTTPEKSPPSQQEASKIDGQPRLRARFSEKIDYIPRPLSTISSETSSSMSTIRASHSLSNSISSVVSANASSSPPNFYQTLRRGQTLQDLEREQSKSRPKTAEARSRPSSGDWEWDFTDAETITKRPSSAPSSDSPSKDTEGFSNVSSSQKSSSDKPMLGAMFSNSGPSIPLSPRNSSAQLPRRRPMSPTTRPRTSPEPKITKRQRKGRSWADLLSRKGRHQDLKGELITRRSPPPLPRQPSPEMEFSFDDINFDEDTTYIVDPTSSYPSNALKTQADYAAWKPRESSPLSETDNSESVLDIDAALDSFDHSASGPSFEDIIGGGSSPMKRPMHSSGATGGFGGPGMHYHRRAESAPELETIDRSRFGFPRLGSNPAMAIEEEEEEDDEEDSKKDFPEQAHTVAHTIQQEAKERAPGLGVNVVEDNTVEVQTTQRVRRQSARDVRLKQDHREELSPVEIVGADEEPRFSMITKSSDESTITPSISPGPLDPFPVAASEDFGIPTTALSYGTSDTTPSTISSPDFTRTSFDGPRMHTATSSITDRTTLNSSRAGDQGPGLHGSIDDVPSLTSSASTMSAHPPRFSSSANSTADRSSSLSAAVPVRTRPVSAHKRLSLASLSRLAGGSYNRSKLNIAESAPIEAAERTVKKKGNRISRMMKFWKSSEKLQTT